MFSSMNRIDEYFVCHLERRRWQNLTAADRTAAAAMAEQDIMAALGLSALDNDDLLLLCAICEQALFLADRHDRTERRRNRETGALKAETVDGLGSRSYYQNPDAAAGESEKAPILAPRTEYFLARHPGYRSNRVTRG